MIKVTQINENKAFLAAVHLADSFNKENFDMALITEPYIGYDKPASLPKDTKAIFTGESPRSCIVYREELSVTEISHLSNKDCSVGLWKTEERKILLVSLYMDIMKSVKQKCILDVINYANRKQFELIIGADSNAHSTMYGTSTNARGRAMEELILQTGV